MTDKRKNFYVSVTKGMLSPGEFRIIWTEYDKKGLIKASGEPNGSTVGDDIVLHQRVILPPVYRDIAQEGLESLEYLEQHRGIYWAVYFLLQSAFDAGRSLGKTVPKKEKQKK